MEIWGNFISVFQERQPLSKDLEELDTAMELLLGGVWRSVCLVVRPKASDVDARVGLPLLWDRQRRLWVEEGIRNKGDIRFWAS